MASKKTEKTPFPEDLKKRMATKKTGKTKKIKEEVETLVDEEVKTEVIINEVTNETTEVKDEIVDLTNITDKDELSNEFNKLKDDPSVVFHVKGESTIEEVNVVVDIDDANQEPTNILYEEEAHSDMAEVETRSEVEEVETQVQAEVEKLVQEVTEKPEPAVETKQVKKKTEKPKVQRKESDYYNDRFANTWGGLQYDW